MKVLIVTGGTIDLNTMVPYIKANHYELTVAVDHGCDFYRQIGAVPNVIVGDFDSIIPSTLAYYKGRGVEVITYPAEKDETDTELGLRIAIERGAHEIDLLGATGTRIDHVLGNIQLLAYALDRGAKCSIIDGNNRIQLIREELIIAREQQYGKYVSLLPFSADVSGVSLTGMKYPLLNENLPTGIARGVSNEIVDKEARITIGSGQVLIIESKD